jgi:hypothetical protein
LGAATTKPHSLSAQFYRVRNRNLRRALFSITGAFNLVSLLPHRAQIMQPQEFLCIAQLPS